MKGRINDSGNVLRYVELAGSAVAVPADSDTVYSRPICTIDKEVIEQSVVKHRYRNLIDIYGH